MRPARHGEAILRLEWAQNVQLFVVAKTLLSLVVICMQIVNQWGELRVYRVLGQEVGYTYKLRAKK